MFAIHEQVARLIKANIEAMLAVTKTAFATAEQFGGLNARTVQDMLTEAAASAQGLFSTQGTGLLSAQSALMQSEAEKIAAYWNGAYEIVAQTRREFAKAIEGPSAEFEKSILGVTETAVKALAPQVGKAT